MCLCAEKKPIKGPTVRAEIITELILERAGPIIFWIFYRKLKAFRLIPVIWPAIRARPEKYWKRYSIPDRAYPAITSVIYQRLIPGNIFPDPL